MNCVQASAWAVTPRSAWAVAHAILPFDVRAQNQLDRPLAARLQIAERPGDRTGDDLGVAGGAVERHLGGQGGAQYHVRGPRLARVPHRQEIMAREIDVLALLPVDGQLQPGHFLRLDLRAGLGRRCLADRRRHDHGRFASGVRKLGKPRRHAHAVLELHPRAVLDVVRAGRLQYEDHLAGRAAADRAQLPLQLVADFRGRRIGADELRVGRQRVLQQHVVRLGRRAILHADAVFDRLARRRAGRYADLDLHDRRRRVLRQAIRLGRRHRQRRRWRRRRHQQGRLAAKHRRPVIGHRTARRDEQHGAAEQRKQTEACRRGNRFHGRANPAWVLSELDQSAQA